MVFGTPRDSLHGIDLIYSQNAGARPDVIITDIVFALMRLIGLEYRPELADLSTATPTWRVSAAARGRIDLDRVRRRVRALVC